MPFISQPLPAASAPTQPRGPGRENGFTGCPESPAGAGRGRQGCRAAEKQLCQSPRPLRRLCSPGFGFFYGGWNREHSLGAAPGRRLLMLTSSRRFFPLQTIKKKKHSTTPTPALGGQGLGGEFRFRFIGLNFSSRALSTSPRWPRAGGHQTVPGWAATTPLCSPPGPWQRATAVPRVYEGKFCFFQPAQLPDPPRRGSGRWHLEGMVALGTRGDTARPQHPRLCRGCVRGRELTEARNHHEELSAPPGHPGYAKGGKRKQTKENEATSCHLSPPSLPRQLRGAAGCVNTRRNPAPPLAWSCGRFQGLPKPSSKPREPGGCSRDAHLLALLSLSPRPLGCAAAVLRSKPLALLWVFLRQRGTEIWSC